MTQQAKITVVEHGIVLVEEFEEIAPRGSHLIVSKKYAVAPGEFFGDRPADVQAACAQAHTEDVIANFKAIVTNAGGEK